jgi:putative ABC transport system permease protein
MSDAGWRTCWELACRDIRGGFRGLRLLFICLLLGVTTLATIGSLTAAVQSELSANGQEFLGGDVQVEISQREAMAEEIAALRRAGRVSATLRTQAMARRADDASAAVLTELKGVDNAYPLYGELKVAGAGLPLSAEDVLIDRALAQRLSAGVGDQLRYGDAEFRIRGLIEDEPDRLGEGFTLGPVAIVSLDGLRRANLIDPGSMFQSKYRIRLAPGADPALVIAELRDRYESAGWELQSRADAAPGASRFFYRMGQFLSLIGLASLVIAGIGVGNGVASYLAARRNNIATLKILGASSWDIGRIYLLEIGFVAASAVALGLAVGAVAPMAISAVLGDLLPVQPGLALHPLPLALSAAYGLLIAGIFSLPPLARARLHPAAALFRSRVDRTLRLDRATLVAVAFGVAAVVALAVGSADNPVFAAIFLAAVLGTLGILVAIGALIRALARRVPRARSPILRMAISNLHRPGSQTIALVLALGLSLTLFVTIAAIQTSLRSEIERSVPERAPDQFVLDVPAAGQARFARLVGEQAPAATFNIVPTLRGTIVAYAGQRVAELNEIPEGAWFLRGDRGLTYSQGVPESSDVVAGRWWPPNYSGPPLISLDAEAARVLNIGVGDTMVVSVLGREISARIASLRRVNWRSLGFNYILVLSPNSLAGAPHTAAATIMLNGASPAPLTRALLRDFPSVSVVDVGELIGRVQTLLQQTATAILLAASVTVLAGIAVLVGALAASRQARTYDSVILKVLGATRLQILGSQALEFAILAAVLAGVAAVLGLASAWYVVVQVFEFTWAPEWEIVLLTLAGGSALTMVIALLGALPLISVRPAQALRVL